jgi:hypothetical protein
VITENYVHPPRSSSPLAQEEEKKATYFRILMEAEAGM